MLSISTWGKTEKVYYVDGGIRTHDPENHDLSTSPFVEELVGYYLVVHLTTCKTLTNNSLLTQTKPSL